MLLNLSKIYRIRANRLLKQARQSINAPRFFEGANGFLKLFGQFASTNREHGAELQKIAVALTNYIEFLATTVAAFDRKNWADAHAGFTASNDKSESTIDMVEQLRNQDNEIFLYSYNGQEIDLSETIMELVNGGRSIITDKFQDHFDEIDAAREKNPEAFNEREIVDDGEDEQDEPLNEIEEVMMQDQTRYAPSDSAKTDEEVAIDAKRRALDAKRYQKRQMSLYNRMTNQDPAVRAAYYELMKAYRDKRKTWNKTYYRNHISNNLPVYQAKLTENALDHKRRKESYYKVLAFKMTDEALKELQEKSPEEFKKVMERRNYMIRLKANSIQTFNQVEKEAITYGNTLKSVKEYDKKKKPEQRAKKRMDKNEKLFEELMRKTRSQY